MIRAAVHVHSDWSYDGSWDLAELAAELGRRGYDAVLTAEHDRGFDAKRWRDYGDACALAGERAGVLVVPGIEYSDAENVVHVPVWGEGLPFLGAGRPSAELIDEAAGIGGAAVLAHPGRREAWRRLGPESLAQLVGIEVWNRKYDGWAPGPAGAEVRALAADAVPFFGLDFHTQRQFFPLAMGIDVDPSAGVAAVAVALRERRCRALAFGLDGERFLGGAGGGAARAAEAGRRAARPAVRLLREPRRPQLGAGTR